MVRLHVVRCHSHPPNSSLCSLFFSVFDQGSTNFVCLFWWSFFRSFFGPFFLVFGFLGHFWSLVNNVLLP